MKLVAIDPGKNGGIAVRYPSGKVIGYRMIDDHKRLSQWIIALADGAQVVIEQVHSMPRQGVVSTFTFGKHYGFLLGCLATVGADYREVPPQKWMRAIGVQPRRKDETKTQFKNRLKSICWQVYPGKKANITLYSCDALLMLSCFKEIFE